MGSNAGRSSTRYVLIDALRGIACLAVVLFHANGGDHINAFLATMPAWLAQAVSYGDSGVSIFFVISGFVIANSMLRDEVTGTYVGRFLLRRSLRLDPPYWAAIALAILTSYLAARAIPGREFIAPSALNLFLHVTYLFDLASQPLISPVFWTLCMEIQFYLSFALLMWLATGLGKRIGQQRARDIILGCCTVIAGLWATPLAPFHVHALFLEIWYPFMAGVLVWRALQGPALGKASLAAAANIILLELALAGSSGHWQAQGKIGLLVALLILMAGHRGYAKTWTGGRVLQWMGMISYSLYLTHNTVLGIGFRLTKRWLAPTALNEGVALVLVILACCAFAWGFFWVFERLGLHLSKKVALHRTDFNRASPIKETQVASEGSIS